MARHHQKPGKLRIISGKLKGRYLSFSPKQGIRPTQDVVRETLFNWLAPYIQKAFCLDLFAGSGALGFEAYSRGAARVLMCEKNTKTCWHLQNNQHSLLADTCDIRSITFSPKVPPLDKKPFDIVFLDPPFAQGLIHQALVWLFNTHSVHERSWIYYEMEKRTCLSLKEFPLKLLRHKQSNTLDYGLLQVADKITLPSPDGTNG